MLAWKGWGAAFKTQQYSSNACYRMEGIMHASWVVPVAEQQ